jgi:hypothetical protein
MTERKKWEHNEIIEEVKTAEEENNLN